nr:hypothetical protein [Burkholderia cepacia]
MNVGSTLEANAKTKTKKCAEPATVFRQTLRVVLSLTDFGTGRWHQAGQGDGREADQGRL